MKKQGKNILLALWLGLLFPAVLLQVMTAGGTQPVREEPAATAMPESRAYTIRVLQENGNAAQMDLNTYVTGVVLGEMPAEFETEALKAQAVVARTYGLRQCLRSEKHPGCVCTDPGCCQAWRSMESFVAEGGTLLQLEKIRSAVADTGNQVILYEGQLIEATFFACSGGSTEDAAAVWGSDVAYLQAVESPGEEKAAAFLRTTRFSLTDLAGRLGTDGETLQGNFIGPVTYTRGGGVATMVLGGKIYTGTQLRLLLELPSTAFYMTAIGDTVTVTSRGHGHRVGMSQYGADAMAATGHDYRQILAHYYQNTQLKEYEP